MTQIVVQGQCAYDHERHEVDEVKDHSVWKGGGSGNAIRPECDRGGALEDSNGGGRGWKDHAQPDCHRDEQAAREW